MANVFDQFDNQGGNVFDQFDAPQQKGQQGAPTTAPGSFLEGIGQGLTFGFGDEAAAALAATVKSPFSDQKWGDLYQQQLAQERANLDAARAQHPVVTGAGEVAGAVGTGAGLSRAGLTLMKGATSIPSAIGRGAVEGAAYGGVYGAGSAQEGQRAEGAVKGALTGAATGAVAGGVSGALAKKAPKPPTTDELRQAAQNAYQTADQMNVIIKPQKFKSFADDLVTTMTNEGIDKDLQGRALAALTRITGTADGNPVGFNQMEILRRVLNGAKQGSMDKSERRLVSIMTSKLDDFMGGLGPTDTLAGNAKIASDSLKAARGYWSRMSKAEVIQNLMDRAKNRAGQFSGSGYENALRTEFRSLAQNPKKLRGFSASEQAAIKRVARGGPLDNIVRYLGKLAPTGVISSAIGSGAGYAIGGPAGAVALPAAGFAARQAATAMTHANATAALNQMLRGAPAKALALPLASPAIAGLTAGKNSFLDWQPPVQVPMRMNAFAP